MQVQQKPISDLNHCGLFQYVAYHFDPTDCSGIGMEAKIVSWMRVLPSATLFGILCIVECSRDGMVNGLSDAGPESITRSLTAPARLHVHKVSAGTRSSRSVIMYKINIYNHGSST